MKRISFRNRNIEVVGNLLHTEALGTLQEVHQPKAGILRDRLQELLRHKPTGD